MAVEGASALIAAGTLLMSIALVRAIMVSSHPLLGLLLVPLGPEDVDEPLAFGIEEHHQLIGYDPAERARGSQLGLRCCRAQSAHADHTGTERKTSVAVYLLCDLLYPH